MTSLYLSRARLRARRGEVLAAVANLLIPERSSHNTENHHRILWMLFGADPDAKRDFLWRDDGDGKYMILSQRPPSDPHGLFDLEQKDFEPHLEYGDRLRFVLRANPTIVTKSAGLTGKPDAKGRRRGQRVDVVMHALKPIARTNWSNGTGRAFERDRIVQQASQEWLARKGEKSGFKIGQGVAVSGYLQRSLDPRRGRHAGYAQVDFSGQLEVTDPGKFLQQLPVGFGSAKAFGCGLMLIRRA